MEMQSLNVLLVEDDPASQRLVERTLSRKNESVAYNVEVAGDLKTARRCLSNNKYDSILLDLHLPDSRGIDTVQAIKEVDSETPLIVVSAISDHQTGVEAIREGADYFLVKGEFMREMLGRSICFSVVKSRLAVEKAKEKEICELNIALAEANDERDGLEDLVNVLVDKFSSVFNSIPCMIWIKDIDGKIVTANDKALEFVDAEMLDVLNENYYEVFGSTLDLDRDDDSDIVKSGRRGKTQYVSYQSDSDETMNLAVERVPYKNKEGSVVGIMVFVHEVPLGNARIDVRKCFSGEEGETEGEVDVKKILVVENDPLNQVLMKLYLDKFGFDISVVEDGQEAIDRVDEEDFDLIFMDIRMPKVNGLQATGSMKAKGLNTPIIAMTADIADGGEQRCLAAGCDAFLSKPIIKKNLHKILERFLDCEFDYSHKTRDTRGLEDRFASV
jgi:CheY-like chemotaxis protein